VTLEASSERTPDGPRSAGLRRDSAAAPGQDGSDRASDRMDTADQPKGLGGTSHAALTRRTLLLLGLVAVAAVLVRLLLFHLPLDPDEGGYAYIATRWAAGSPLYSAGAWVDRPAGLMLAFRFVTDISYSATAIRAAAMLCGVVLSLGAASAAWALAGRRAAVVAGFCTAVLSAGAFVQGYEFNGELIASAVGVAGVAALFWWRRGRSGSGMLVVAGVFCGSALLMKQSALDPLVVLVAVLVVDVRRREPGRRVAPVLAAAVGVAIPIGAALLFAALTGWSRAWYAVVSFQAAVGAGVGAGARISQQALTLLDVLPDLLGAALVAGIGAVAVIRARRARPASADRGPEDSAPDLQASDRSASDRPALDWPVLIWPIVAAVEVLAGPFAHRHYWVQAVAPLCVIAAVAIARKPLRVLAALTAVIVVVPVVTQAYLATQSDARRTALVVHDDRLARNPAVSAWIRAHTSPHDTIYAFVASADLYLLADRLTGYPYLWYANIQTVPGAVAELARWLDGPSAPRWIVLYQDPGQVDPSGRLQQILDQRYRTATVVDGVPILVRS
jgi:hypothetical protein